MRILLAAMLVATASSALAQNCTVSGCIDELSAQSLIVTTIATTSQPKWGISRKYGDPSFNSSGYATWSNGNSTYLNTGLTCKLYGLQRYCS